MKKIFVLVLLLFSKIFGENTDENLNAQECFSNLNNAYEGKKWKRVVELAEVLTEEFSYTPFNEDSLFYKAVAYFHLGNFEKSDECFSAYLKGASLPRRFEEALGYKFEIAEKFRSGEKLPLLGWKGLPKLASSKEKAVKIYDEIIATMPHHELSAKALFGKGKILFKDKSFKQSIDTLKTLIKRFPKNNLAIESYIIIAKVYLRQCQEEYPDVDFLDLAEINFRNFCKDFPSEPRQEEVQKVLLEMKSVYADHLYEIADFFLRTKKPKAAAIYYHQIIKKYPDSNAADKSKEKLSKLKV